jgi:hypothetical protein
VRLPAAPRERRPGLAALAVLLILGGALITVTLVLRSGDRVSAIEVSRRIGAGQPIPLNALREVQVADDGVRYIRWSDREKVSAYYAAVDLVPGTLLNPEMLVEQSRELRPGKAVVGLSLKPGQLPPGLVAGNRVQVIFVPGDDSDGKPVVLAKNALVNWVDEADETSGGDTRSVEVVVDSTASPVIAAYASSQRIALAYLPGVTAEDGGGQGGEGDAADDRSAGNDADAATARPTPQATAQRRATPGAQPSATASRTSGPRPTPAAEGGGPGGGSGGGGGQDTIEAQ